MTNPFDLRAKTWDTDPRRLQNSADLFSVLEKRIPLRPDMSVLDYGCGTGLLTLALAPRVRSVTAVDSSRGMLDALSQKTAAAGIRNVAGFPSDFTTDPLPPGPYDLIASAMTLHHVADTESLFRKFFALLAPDGFLALADLDTEDGTFHSNADGIHHFGFDRETLSQQLAASGFTEARFSTALHIEKNARTYPVFLATARKC